jgi:isopentenyl phosphate kinase/N-acetylglutamate synthase-like GNAT family acetyltransferase
MGNSRALKEAIDYINLCRGKVVVIKISKAVIGESQRLSNVIRDVSLLVSAGIRIVIAHAQPHCEHFLWQGIEPNVQLDSADLSGVERKIAKRITPVIFLSGPDPTARDQMLVAMAKDVGAVKVVYVTKQDGLFRSKDSIISEMNIAEAREMINHPDELVTLDMRGRMEAAVKACEAGIYRVHIIGSREGSLLKEILTSEGSGTMIYDRKYKSSRKAGTDDAVDIFEVIRESIRQTADSMSLEFIVSNINHFQVFTVDDQIHGCVMVKIDPSGSTSEISYLGVSSVYESPAMLRQLVDLALSKIPKGVKRVTLDPEKNTIWLGIYPWFKKMGFAKSSQLGKWTKTF